MTIKTVTVATVPFKDQEPGTSGLRKPVKTFKGPKYTENFVQSIFNFYGDQLQGSTFILGGDGRYYCKDAAKLIVQMCAANGVRKVLVGQNGILSTPAASHLIRQHKTLGGIILTASHNPGGPDKDFGIKLNMANGGAAPSNVTKKIYEISLGLSEYKIAHDLAVSLDEISTQEYEVDGHAFTLEVIDPVCDYVELMKSIFDFNAIRDLLKGSFKIRIDCMHGVTGPYASAIFLQELGAPEGSVVNSVPLEDFGGGHPDPNLTYAADLVNVLKKGEHDFGAAYDGDGDRNMILGKNGFFVSPSDSLAVLADNLNYIPYFNKMGVKGFARSMPTAGAVDRVGNAKNLKVFEVPTGWKFFCNLLDANLISICGEESFGTGSNHIREKDGIWASLAWLNVLACAKNPLETVVRDHWTKYGRDFTLRCDYENCKSEDANRMIQHLESVLADPKSIGTNYGSYKLVKAENFSYTDPVENVTVSKQGLRFQFEPESKAIIRLSGTGSSGATIRMYFEMFSKDTKSFDTPREKLFENLIKAALQLAKLKEFIGTETPTVIT